MTVLEILIVKRVANEIARPLSAIFNLSLTTGIFPDQLKIAKVSPFYKKDDNEIFSNYRPVSVLPCFLLVCLFVCLFVF